MCGPEPLTSEQRTRTDLALDDLNERVKELVNVVRELKDLIDPPDLPPVKVTGGNQPVKQAKGMQHAYFAARP